LWWDDDFGEFSSIRFFVNPVRYSYFKRVLQREGARPGATVLDVGCGGGILAEEFARDGFQVTGVDPAPESVAAARAHAAASGLSITYKIGSGERLPFPDAAFDYATCCDVLEHVDDVERVIGEIARVLKPGGLFFYDTINRTCISWLAMIKVMQDWKATAFAEPNTHVWEKFIKPRELTSTMRHHGLVNRQIHGISTRRGPISVLLGFWRRAKGKMSFHELGEYLGFCESRRLGASYMGYAARKG
jgi:2-polyprenyl-6-hydroxyphenyl methylase/3-demethylubiquinone-9 3-methyltransferase